LGVLTGLDTIILWINFKEKQADALLSIKLFYPLAKLTPVYFKTYLLLNDISLIFPSKPHTIKSFLNLFLVKYLQLLFAAELSIISVLDY
jgi:hypothetical protein